MPRQTVRNCEIEKCERPAVRGHETGKAEHASQRQDAGQLHIGAGGIRVLLPQQERVQRLDQANRDSEAYDLVIAAYKLPKGTDEEKALRSAAIQNALRSAIAAPFDVIRACAAAMERAVPIASFGNPSAASDVQVGLELLTAALRGARLNVEINLGSVKDTDYVTTIRAKVDEYERAMPGPG